MLTVTKPTACVFGTFDRFCLLFYITTLCQMKRQTAPLSQYQSGFFGQQHNTVKWEDFCIDRNTILTHAQTNRDVQEWTGFIWLRILIRRLALVIIKKHT